MLRPMPPTARAAPVTRIGLSCLGFVVMSLTLGYVQKTNWQRRACWNETQGGTPRGGFARLICFPPRCGDASVAAEFLRGEGSGLRYRWFSSFV
jgi:hypothetical protein